MAPDEGLYHLSSKPTIVLLPEPLWPCPGQFVVAKNAFGRPYHQGSGFACGNFERKAVQDCGTRTGRIGKSDVVELD